MPVTFFSSHDRLAEPRWVEALPAIVYNALVANGSGKAVFLCLPSAQMLELQGHVDLRRLSEGGAR